MASKRVFTEDDFSCSVCCDIFKDPALLPCGHSACRGCIKQYWSYRGPKECPLCRKRCHKSPHTNLVLRNLSETFRELQGDPETLCDSHGETLKFYCVDEARLVCVVCRESEKHQNHTFRPVDEMAAQMKNILQSALESVKVNLKSVQDAQINCQQNINQIKQQAQHIRKQITGEFEKLHQILRAEKKATLTALGEEAQQRTQRLEEHIEKLNTEMQSFSNTIEDISKECNSKNFHFIKNFDKALERAQCTQTCPVASTEEIEVAKYLGNLQFRVWEKVPVFRIQTQLILSTSKPPIKPVLGS
ncbi:E3 ubiquitin-protein ligase TRIM39-like [Hoplias malabaricus]|uniref:E3 ubiquitin-protein ligase TRIM39-like n=1 Tax=Hoplias malabaricus TaxID=27720 RepID=UPI003462B26B